MSRKIKPISELSSAQVYWILFRTVLVMSASTFGGGFVIISMMKKKFVDEMHWLTEEEMLDMTAIAQSAPGALGVNIAVVVGYRIRKFRGALVSTAAAVIPPLVIISIITVFYNQFRSNQIISLALTVMRAGVAAVIVDVVISLAQSLIKTKSVLWITVMAAAFVSYCFFDVSAIALIAVCAALGLADVYIRGRKAKDKEERRGSGK